MNRRMCNRFLIVMIAGLVGLASAQGFRLNKPDAVGGGLVAVHQDGVGESTSAGAGLEIFLKYNISPKFFITAGTGVYTVTDGSFQMDTFRTTLFPTAEVKAGFNLIQGSKFTPIIFFGIHGYGHKTTNKAGTSTDLYYDGDVFAGAGFNYSINDQWSFRASGVYRYVFTQDVDPKSKFWVAKAGLSYSLNKQDFSDREEIEYPLDSGEIVLDDLFREENSGTQSEQDALALLFQPENEAPGVRSETNSNASTTVVSSDVQSLLNRIEEIKSEMDRRLMQLEDIETKVRANERAIAQVTGRVAGEYAGNAAQSFGVSNTENFKANYETALQRFYNKNYQDAIRTFRGLLSSNPDHRLASNCQYWIGECFNAMGDYQQAIEAFNAVLRFRLSYKFDDALIMNGLCHLKIGDRMAARENFQRLVSQYPDSEYAPKAMRYLGRL